MAGRGTDIKLGEGVADRGGLAVIGTERHESRRIDNQLRGRAGRQGDPGSSRFYVSFEDGIMKRFTPDWLPGMLDKVGLEDGAPLESGMVGKALEQAQQKVETYHFDIRKHLVDYDDVINRQREVIYAERDKVLNATDDLPLIVEDMLLQTIDDLQQSFANELWDETTADEFWQESAQLLPLTGLDRDALYGAELDECVEALQDHAAVELQRLGERIDAETAEGTSVEILRGLVLRTMDRLWICHLTEIDGLRQGVGLQAYGQQDPLVTYKREAFDMFDQLVAALRREVSAAVMHATVQVAQPTPGRRRARGVAPAQRGDPVRVSNVRESGGTSSAAGGVAVATRPTTSAGQKVGRNAPCPCGSGKKFKRCCGKAA